MSKVNKTARSQRIVGGFLSYSEEIKEGDVAKCVSTIKFRVFKSGDLGGQVEGPPPPTSVTVVVQRIKPCNAKM